MNNLNLDLLIEAREREKKAQKAEKVKAEQLKNKIKEQQIKRKEKEKAKKIEEKRKLIEARKIEKEKAEKLTQIYQADKISPQDVEKIASESDVILNATPVDLQDKILPLMKDTSVYYDINYKFQVKEQKGVKVVNGSLMLILQGARAFTIWTGQDAPIDVMKKAIGYQI